ncbi:MAG: hypothetical protein IT365_07060 [Candidatus Hydrogenedentes bacterium]|nr:hypothetical protein [Candidatus Hydrogenedentota bacterium]
MVIRVRRVAVVLVLCLVVLALSLIVRSVIENQPEYQQSKSAVEGSSEVRDVFGSPIVVKRGPRGIYHKSSESGAWGTYTFYVEGSKTTGTVFVHWSNPHGGKGFQVESLWIQFPGEDPEEVWPGPDSGGGRSESSG